MALCRESPGCGVAEIGAYNLLSIFAIINAVSFRYVPLGFSLDRHRVLCCGLGRADSSFHTKLVQQLGTSDLSSRDLIVVVAVRFGNFAGMLGTIAGALVFAVFLFEPRFSIMINDVSARNHLIWMVLIGVVVSDLLGAYSLGGTNTSKHS